MGRKTGSAPPLLLKALLLVLLPLLHLHSIPNPTPPSIDADVSGQRRTSEDYEQGYSGAT